MADKRIDELEEALSITANDLFVLEQASTAKKLTGQTMTNFLLSLANGHGGISTIAKTSSSGTNPVVDTYTITYADTTTSTFQITNGVKGDTGAQGPQGPDGNDITITSSTVDYQAWASGTTYPTGTWVSNPPAVSQGAYLWTRVIVNYSDGNQTVAYSVARMGVDGTGAVSTVNNVSPDGNGNVALTASDVGALDTSYQPPVTSVNTKTGDVVLDNEDVQAPYGLSMSKSLSSAGWYRVLQTNDLAGQAFDVFICRKGASTDNETHKIILSVLSAKYVWQGEESASSTHQYIDKIRYTNDSSYAYVDVHFTGTSANTVYVDFRPHGAANGNVSTSKELTAVNDSPTGETILSTFTFVKTSGAAIEFTPTSGTSYSTFGGCWYARQGNMVQLHVGLSGLTANTLTTIFTMPTGFIPQTFQTFGGGYSTYHANLVIQSSGTVQITSESQYACVDATYFV